MLDRFIERNIDIAKWNVKNLNINLKGLTVLTECASNAYGFLPYMAALAGANVHAYGRSSSYGSFESNKAGIENLLLKSKLENQVIFHDSVFPDAILPEVDILTNSGFLRPITNQKISKLKKTAVIPLMWETWELREGEIDIKSCQNHLIPVIGTNEHYKDSNMFPYPGMLAMKMLFDAGFEIANNKFVLLGGGLTGKLIAETLKNNNIDFIWFGHESEKYNDMRPYSLLKTIFDNKRLDAIIVADHVFNKEILGNNGYINFESIHQNFPYVKICHICGNINIEELMRSSVEFFPEKLKSFGYMSYETINIGWEPVIMLGCAGLKVGEIAVRKRIDGCSIEDTISETLNHGIGMDFEGGFMNFNYGH